MTHLEQIRTVNLPWIMERFPTALNQMYENADMMEDTRCGFKVSRKDFVDYLIPFPEKIPEYIAKYPVEDTSKDFFIIEEGEFDPEDNDVFY